MYDTTNPDNHPQPKESSEGLKFIGQIIVIVLLALGLAFISLRFIMQGYEVDGQSMETTLHDGDRLIVWKAAKTWNGIRNKSYVPERYDIVVIDRPLFVETGGNTIDHLIKRVIGLPGEKVIVRDGVVTIYNDENPDGFNPDVDQEYYPDAETTEGEAVITVGENEIFVLGDNRSNSLDSRRFGAVNVSHITGVAEVRIAPLGSMRKL